MTTSERLIAWCSVTDGGCWLWLGDTAGNGESNQYGRIRVNGKAWRAHRLSYVNANGPIPDGLVIDHLCRNRLCINPAHLEAVPQRVNVMRGEGVGAANARKTTCANGHPFTPENTIVCARRGGTFRGCRTCRAASSAKYRSRAPG